MENGKVISIRNVENLLKALKTLGMDLKPSFCGGKKDTMTQEREQWHSGANFFALGPGKLVGYNRNVHTLEDLHQSGYHFCQRCPEWQDRSLFHKQVCTDHRRGRTFPRRRRCALYDHAL